MNQSRRVRLVLCLIAGAAGAGEAARHLARRIERVEVVGDSMRPALAPGDRLLVLRGGRIRPGAIVALDDPRAPVRVMVKRVDAVFGERVTVFGDNRSTSTDSRHFGPIDIMAIHGPVLYRYAPRARAKWLGPMSTTRP